MTSPRTLLEALIQKLRGCNVSSDAELDSVAVLWTDPRSKWKPLITLLRQQIPELIELGGYDPEQQQDSARALAPGAAARTAWLAGPTRRSAPGRQHT
jgi:hypothetical protein